MGSRNTNKCALIPTNQDESNICISLYIYIYILYISIYLCIYIYFLDTTFSIPFYDFAEHFESISLPIFAL